MGRYIRNQILQALPEVEKETLKMPRQYIANVINTIVGEPFAKWVTSKVNQRHAQIAEERDMHIEMDPQVAAVYQKSQAVSGK